MKKLFGTVLIIAVLALALTIGAFASEFDYLAQDLNSLGLFQGTGDGFDLDAVPTRAQALTMLVRLLGEEDDAKADDYAHPFSDVPVWAEAVVGYAYQKGYTKGVSDTEFGSNNTCDAKMYCTFVLRALNYDDTQGDFSYDTAVDFAESVGLIDDYINDGAFLRDDLVAVSYMALSAEPQGLEYDTLLSKLVDDGAVKAADAQPLLDRFDAYRDLADSVALLNAEQRIQFTQEQITEQTMFGQTYVSYSEYDITQTYENGAFELSMVGETETDGQTMTTAYYYKDGYLYYDIYGVKYKEAANLEEAMEQAGSEQSIYPLYAYLYIEYDSESATTLIRVAISEDYANEVIAEELGEAFELVDIKYNYCLMDYYLDADGEVTEMMVDMGFIMSTQIEGMSITADVTSIANIKIVATGSKVPGVVYPSDLSSYEEA